MLVESIQAEKNRYLIVAPSWVGDMVMSHTLVQYLKMLDPDCEIDMLAPKWTHPLVSAMPEVNRVIESPFKHGELNLSARRKVSSQLRALDYTHAIVLPNSFKSALIPWLAGIPNRIGWKGEYRYGLLNQVKYLDKKEWPLMIERFMALVKPAGKSLPKIRPQLKISEKLVDKVVAKFSIDLQQGSPVIFAPGAEYGEAKRWPPEYFAELAKMLTQKGLPVWILGSPNDEMLSDKIMQGQNELVRNFIGDTSLNEAIALISLAGFVLSNDSGLMHVAAALDKPMLAIYGSSDTRFTPPLSEKAKVLTLNLKCSPCFERTCPLQHLNCLKDIKPEFVIKELMEWKAQCVF